MTAADAGQGRPVEDGVVRSEAARKPLDASGPSRLLERIRRPLGVRSQGRAGWAIPLLLILVVLVVGTSGFLALKTSPKLDFVDSLYDAVKLFTFDLGPADYASPKPDPQIWIAFVLAAIVVLRGVQVLVRGYLRRFAIRWLLHGHTIVCGAGVNGTELVRTLAKTQDVVLVDRDALSLGMQAPARPHEWRLTGDAVSSRTLQAAGVLHANRVIAVTGDDLVNSQIVSTLRELATERRVRDRVHVLVQLEDPELARFLEEDTDTDAEDDSQPAAVADDAQADTDDAPAEATPAPRPLVTPFSANAIAAHELLNRVTVRSGPDGELPLLALRDGEAPRLLLVGDHPLIDSLALAMLSRWRVRILRELEGATGRVRPPARVSIYGSGAEARVARLHESWHIQSGVMTLEGRDSPELADGSGDPDEWLLEHGRGQHAIVVCVNDLEAIGLTLSVARALGDRARVTRVSTQPENALDTHVEARTKASPRLASTDIEQIAELGANPDRILALRAPQRLADALATRPGAQSPQASRQSRERADDQAAALFASHLGVHTQYGWRGARGRPPVAAGAAVGHAARRQRVADSAQRDPAGRAADRSRSSPRPAQRGAAADRPSPPGGVRRLV